MMISAKLRRVCLQATAILGALLAHANPLFFFIDVQIMGGQRSGAVDSAMSCVNIIAANRWLRAISDRPRAIDWAIPRFLPPFLVVTLIRYASTTKMRPDLNTGLFAWNPANIYAMTPA